MSRSWKDIAPKSCSEDGTGASTGIPAAGAATATGGVVGRSSSSPSCGFGRSQGPQCAAN
eukprot:scaffold4779_cov116-Isochrysis_galbana.AAC.14